MRPPVVQLESGFRRNSEALRCRAVARVTPSPCLAMRDLSDTRAPRRSSQAVSGRSCSAESRCIDCQDFAAVVHRPQEGWGGRFPAVSQQGQPEQSGFAESAVLRQLASPEWQQLLSLAQWHSGQKHRGWLHWESAHRKLAEAGSWSAGQERQHRGLDWRSLENHASGRCPALMD